MAAMVAVIVYLPNLVIILYFQNLRITAKKLIQDKEPLLDLLLDNLV